MHKFQLRMSPDETLQDLANRMAAFMPDTQRILLFENPACEGCPRCMPDKRIDPWAAQKKEALL